MRFGPSTDESFGLFGFSGDLSDPDIDIDDLQCVFDLAIADTAWEERESAHRQVFAGVL